MNDEFIENEEVLYRAFTLSKPNGFKDGNPTAALFLDENGVSVDRDGSRSEEDIIDRLKNRFKKQGYDCSIKISAEKCRECNTYPIPKPSRTNKYHAEIHQSETELCIDLFNALKLAKLCEVVR